MAKKVEIVIDDQMAGGVQTRMKFNDIRLVGPLLILALIGALMISPAVSGADQSVGNPSICSDVSEVAAGPDLDLVAVGLISLCPTPGPTVAPTVAPTAAPTVVPVAPAALPVFQPREKVMGPTWLGPIVPTVHGDQITMKFPELLSVFIGEENVVTVKAPGGGTVYKGLLPRNRTISFTGLGGNYVVTSELVTTADYTEIVPVSPTEDAVS